MFKKMSKKGFTLVELLIVIVIIGILAVTVAPKFTGGPARARDALRKSDLNNTASGVDTYIGSEATDGTIAGCVTTGLTDIVTKKYLSSLPKDPVSTTAPIGTGYCTTAGEYAYLKLADGGYALFARVEKGSKTETGVTCLPTTAWTSTNTVQEVMTQIQTDPTCTSDTGDVYIIAH